MAAASLLSIYLSIAQDESPIDVSLGVRTEPLENLNLETNVVTVDQPKVEVKYTNRSFLAPKEGESPVTNVKEIIQAFLSGKAWQQQLPLVFNSEAVAEQVKEFYQEPRPEFEKVKVKIFQMELDPYYGGPFWVYLVTKSEENKGFPIIVRKQGEYLKIDWKTFAEFSERHFVEYIDGKKKRPGQFRVIVEPLKKYSGPDRDGFQGLDKYDCYKLFPPYGEYEEFTEYAFTLKHSPIANELASKFQNDDTPLAMVLNLDFKSFNHMIRHSVITDMVCEGWLVEPVEKD